MTATLTEPTTKLPPSTHPYAEVIHRLEAGALVHGAIAAEGHRHAVVAADLGRERGPHGLREAAVG